MKKSQQSNSEQIELQPTYHPVGGFSFVKIQLTTLNTKNLHTPIFLCNFAPSKGTKNNKDKGDTKMGKVIGIAAIVAFMYVGFCGCEKYDIKPFIAEWLKSDDTKKNVKKTREFLKENGGKFVKNVGSTIGELVNE